MFKHFTISVSGKVQGVFFRAIARDHAQKLGLTGFVQNMPDGSVYIEAEGEEEALNVFLSWCHVGPDSAQVDKVSVKEDKLKRFNIFLIKRSEI